MSTQSATPTSPDNAVLGLGSVLVSSLPAALMTEHAPASYTVEAVFTRRPEREEIVDIVSDETRELLIREGYPAVELTVSDRRLDIANTTLEELRDGLGAVLGERLAAISDRAHARRDAAALHAAEAAGDEKERAAAVVAMAASVNFARRGSGV